MCKLFIDFFFIVLVPLNSMYILFIISDVVWANGREGGYLVFGNMVYTVSVLAFQFKNMYNII